MFQVNVFALNIVHLKTSFHYFYKSKWSIQTSVLSRKPDVGICSVLCTHNS